MGGTISKVAEVGALSNAFTPVPCLLGGLAMGIATAGKLLLTGRVLGISGAVKGLLEGDIAPWRLCFLGGLLVGGLGMTALVPDMLEKLPASFTVSRAVVGSLLVGLGSSLGNGCTSGHGISGNARLSKRSILYTCVFMGSAVVTATLTGTTRALGIPNIPAPYQHPSEESVAVGFKLIGTVFGTLAVIGVVGRTAKHLLGGDRTEESCPRICTAVNSGAEFVSGATFGTALVYSGMVRNVKVAAFLNMLAPSRDFSLMFVMGGALLVATPLVQLILSRSNKPLCGKKYQVPDKTVIDQQLLVGGVLFGAGWGYVGSCPGPAFVNMVANPSVVNVASSVSVILGMAMAKHLRPYLGGSECKFEKNS